MPDYPHLANAPISEALIDFRVRLAADTTQETLHGVVSGLAAQYPKIGPIHQFQGQIHFGDEGPTSVQGPPQLLGYRIDSVDGLHVAQVRIDGFTFSRLAPYESWDRMLDNAWVVWERFLDQARPLGVERIATRFINRVNLPPSGQLAEVLRVPLGVSAGTMQSFLFRYHLAPMNGVTAIVSLATEESAEPSIVLDIDCFVRNSFPTDTTTLQRHLTRVRDAKNRIFFESLTPEAIRRFQ